MHQLLPGEVVDGVAVLGAERVPQTAPFVVGSQLGHFHRNHVGRRQHDLNPPGGIVDVYLGALVEIDAGENLTGDHHERAFGGPQTAVLVHDHVSNRGLARHQLGHGPHLLDHHAVVDSRLSPRGDQSAAGRYEMTNRGADEDEGTAKQKQNEKNCRG